jgi:hypothetical protein
MSASLVEGSFTPAGMDGLLMRVDTASQGSADLVSTDAYTDGRLIRVATNRAYTANDTVGLGNDITQPASTDGGSVGMTVGQSCAHIPFGTDTSADVAARTAREYNENPRIHRTDTTSDRITGVQRNYGALVGETMQIYHRGSDGTGIDNVTVTEIREPGGGGSSGTATITYPTDSGTTTTSQTLSNQILTDTPPTATATASGSPAVVLMNESIAGVFVGISDAGEGVITPISSIENALGARTVTGLRLSPLHDH